MSNAINTTQVVPLTRLPISEGLSTFNGGIHPEIMKDMSVQRPLAVAALPKQLILPLGQHIGQMAEPLVTVGEHVLKGQLIARAPSYVSAPIHAPTSGTVTHIGEQSVPHPSGLTADCITIEPDGDDQWCELFPIEDYQQLDVITLRNKVREAGIVGLGGAAFPTAVKLNPGPNRDVTRLIINGAECEPYITCDQTLMTERADEVIKGIQIIMHIIGVESCWIGIEDTMPTAYQGLTKAIEAADESARIEVKVVPTIYPTGGEKQLIKVLTGLEVPSNGLPADLGLVCHNPGTAAAIYHAICEGKPLISRLLTVTGNGIQAPQNFEVLFGTPIAHLVEQAGGYTARVERLIMGGPMMGFAVHTDTLPIVKATNCILAAETGEIADPEAADPCIRCGACADACPANLLPQQLYWYSKSRQFDVAKDDYNLFDCIECGCCSHVCPSNIPLVQYYRFSKTEIRNAEAEKRKSDRARERHEFRLERLEREQQEAAEKLKKKREELARKQAAAAQQDSAGDSTKDAIAAAVARAQARKAQLAAERNQAAKPENRSDTSADAPPSKPTQAAPVDARSEEQSTSTGQQDAKAAAIAAAKAKALANIQAKAKANTQPKQGDAPHNDNRADSNADNIDPKQAAIAAAKAKALAKAKANSQANSQPGQGDAPHTDNSGDNIDPKQAAIAAAKARALAKAKAKSSSE